MGSLQQCRIEGFICRLCSQIERIVIHIYSDEGLQKKLEQKINVYLKINLSRFDQLPKTICLPCDAKLEQHHRFIQKVIQNQKKIQGDRPIIPLLEQHLRVRVTPAAASDAGGGTNTYNIEAISSSSESSSSSSSNSYMDTEDDLANGAQASERNQAIDEDEPESWMDYVSTADEGVSNSSDSESDDENFFNPTISNQTEAPVTTSEPIESTSSESDSDY